MKNIKNMKMAIEKDSFFSWAKSGEVSCGKILRNKGFKCKYSGKKQGSKFSLILMLIIAIIMGNVDFEVRYEVLNFYAVHIDAVI